MVFQELLLIFALDTIKVEGILKLLEGEDRACEFRHCLSYFDGSNFEYFQSTAKGSLALSERGNKKSWALHRVFIPEHETKTIAEMNPSEFTNYRSSRKDYYTAQFARWLKKS